MTGMSSKRISRRLAASAILSAPAVPLLAVPQAPQQPALATELDTEVREQLRRNLEALRKQQLSTLTEPSFSFRVF